jgi:hydroxyproline O-arabinosyltransferase
VHYHWYRVARAAGAAGSHRGALGGYTRVLHCGRPDDIMHLVPTLAVEPLPLGIDRGYGPMHRPWAFTQWLSRAHIPEEFILMSEPDHLLIAPPPLLATVTEPAAAPFAYIDCRAPRFARHCLRGEFNPGLVPAERVPPVRGHQSRSSRPPRPPARRAGWWEITGRGTSMFRHACTSHAHIGTARTNFLFVQGT